jgi:GH3 auxin-responsive promoter
MFDVVSATEGAMGLQAERLGVYRPALARSLMLFADVDDPSDRRFAWELIAGREYDVLLGSFSGLQGYRVGDRVRVVSAKPLRFSLVPRGVDVGATWGLLGAGATDFCAYLDPSTRALRLLVEGKEPPALAPRRAASDASVRLVDAGRIARAAVALTLRGVAKLPRIHSRPDLQAIVERCA